MQGKSVFPLILPNCLHVLQPIHISERRSHPLSSLRRGFNLHLGLRATLLIHSLYNFESKQENGIGVVQSCKGVLSRRRECKLAMSIFRKEHFEKPIYERMKQSDQ
uniref:Uncharacterized protein n=1 Tax=Physcomitrium patens TaxID=3218 RepID=A0A2K1KLY2_PHYPA|nr:hypothetical protein PHYPA_005672 [Physcomitrium patens]